MKSIVVEEYIGVVGGGYTPAIIGSAVVGTTLTIAGFSTYAPSYSAWIVLPAAAAAGAAAGFLADVITTECVGE